MHRSADETTPAAPAEKWLWLTIVVLGAVFFVKEHDLRVSQYEQYAPWAASSEATPSGGNVAKGLAVGLVALLGTYYLVRGDRPLRLGGTLSLLLAFYCAWATASVAWSIDPALTVRRLAVAAFCVIGALGIARRHAPRDLAAIAMVVMGAYLAIGVAAEAALGTFRPLSAGYRFAGTLHPNSQGFFMATFCLAAFCLARDAPRHRKWLLAAMALGFCFLLLTRSRTAMAGLALGLAAVWFVGASNRARLYGMAAAVWVICTAALTVSLLGLDVQEQALRAVMLGRQEQSEALTGRLPIWTELTRYVQQRPLTGYGYESFWTAEHIEDVSEDVQWLFREAHSAYLDAVLSVGLIGAAALLMIVLLGIYRAAAAYRAAGDPGHGFTLGLMAVGLVNAALESGIIGANFVSLLIGCGLVQLATAPRPEPAAGPAPENQGG